MFNKTEFYSAALEKAKIALGVKSDNQLAKVLGNTVGSISHARHRGTFPAKALMDTCIDKNISMDFILGIKPEKKSDGELV